MTENFMKEVSKDDAFSAKIGQESDPKVIMAIPGPAHDAASVLWPVTDTIVNSAT